MSSLRPLRTWRRGWHLATGILVCCGGHVHPLALAEGRPVYLTSEPGDAYCQACAEKMGQTMPVPAVKRKKRHVRVPAPRLCGDVRAAVLAIRAARVKR